MSASIHSLAGATLVHEQQPDTELVWVDLTILGGSAADPLGFEGLHRHTGLLARRGAGERDREQFDLAIDQLGASIEIGVGRDTTAISATVLRKNVSRLVPLLQDLLSAPSFRESEHAKLLRETPQVLDEVREDNQALASRWFDHLVSPGHVYGRSALGTSESFLRLTRSAAQELWQRELSRNNLIIGMSGACPESEAIQLAQTVLHGLASHAPPQAPNADYQAPARSRAVLVHKDERTQAQVRVGRLMPKFGHPSTAALTLIEAAFGGMFSSRLMQEIRVKRGWSYGAGCSLRRSRLPHWFEIAFACDIHVAVEAAQLVSDMFDALVTQGLRDDEIDFAKRYLAGATAFQCATPRQRVQLTMRDLAYGLPAGYALTLMHSIAEVSHADIRQALSFLHPEASLLLVVASAEHVSDGLRAWKPDLETREFDAY